MAGPLKAERFLLAKTRLDEGDDISGAGADSLYVLCKPLLPALVLLLLLLLPPRTTRILLGRWEAAFGVVGRTLTEALGDLGAALADAPASVEVVSALFDDADDALERECLWWILRTEETDEDVDLRPRRPAEDRRYELRGVRGDGDKELRLLELPLNGRGGCVIDEGRAVPGYEALLGVRLLAFDERLAGVDDCWDWPKV